jgi:FKBP-type peptidyl-prolyl cis-trans isomerase
MMHLIIFKGEIVKKFIYPFLLVLIFTLILGCETGAQNSGDVKLESQKDSISYFIGSDIARSLVDIKEEIDIDVLLRALRDGYEGQEPLLTQAEMMATMQEFSNRMRKVREEKQQQEALDNKAAGEAFLEENKTKEGIMVTPSGLQYQVLEEGFGAKPTASDRVTVHYRGTLIDGTEFDSSYKNGQPITFSLGGVIPGWTEALQLMNTGSKYKLFIPSELGYGERGSGPNSPIGPNEVLIFEVELISIEN